MEVFDLVLETHTIEVVLVFVNHIQKTEFVHQRYSNLLQTFKRWYLIVKFKKFLHFPESQFGNNHKTKIM
jgi:hypothetical protein